jgi:hypothetical protein
MEGETMNPLMSIPQKSPGLFKVGDNVRAKYGWPGVVGEIIEDYGNTNKKGRRIYTVRWHTEDEPEIPTAEEDLEPASDPNGSASRK